MLQLFIAYQPLIDLFLLHSGLALAQYLVLRAGVFSIANAGLTAIGAYLAAGLTLKAGWPPALTMVLGAVAGMLVSMLLSLPLARLRGVYQAIATLAFVQVVLSLNVYSESLTGGAMGMNGIPKVVSTWTLLIALAGTLYIVWAINQTRLGRAFDAIRQDETVAASLGTSVRYYQTVAFALSGGIAGFYGGLEAFHSYSIEPSRFGFEFVVAILSYVVLGGRRSIWGPVVGTAVLLALPELARPLADYRTLVYGLIMVLVMGYLPRGVYDTFVEFLYRRRIARMDRAEMASSQGGAS
jgi:branched-chain amino acid transport system permease protein